MTFPRVYIAVPLVLALAGGGYWLYNANAIQAGGSLAQVPLNSSVTVPPAFIMAVDDSGSMTFQTLFPGSDGMAFWKNPGNNPSVPYNGYFTGTGVNARLRTQADSWDSRLYHHTIPSKGYRINSDRVAIPPVDTFGFARSPDINPAYFNPLVTYGPWKRPDASSAIVDYPAADVTNTRVSPDNAAPTISLTSDWRGNGDAEEAFRFPQGSTLPAGSYYRITGNCGGLNQANSWKQLAKAHTFNESCDVYVQYWPATFYLKSATAGAAFGYTAAPTEAVNACGEGCSLYKYVIKSTNFSGTKFTEMQQNFANWFSFYGNRNRAMKAALTQSLERTEQMRVGMFQINDDNDTRNYPKVTMYDMSVPAEKSSLYTQHLLLLKATGNTPNRWAVQHLGEQFMRPSEPDPDFPNDPKKDKAPIRFGCQINAGMLFTDGYSNDSGPTVGIGNQDGGMPAPLADGHADTLADIAAKYYNTTLRRDKGLGMVPVPEACKTTPNDPRLDCRTDPHMNFYGITLGAKGDIYGKTYNPVTNTPDPYTPAGYPAWRSRQDDAPSTVDEIWHATMNARGKYINATTPADITSAMREILASVGGGATPSGTIALSGARVGDNTLSVEPTYESANSGTDWFSRLTAYGAKNDPITGTINFTTKWEAASQISAAGRTVRFGTTAGGNVKPTVVDFAASALGATDAAVQTALCTDALQNCANKFNRIVGGVTGAEAVAYLRGDRANDGGKLRKRTTLLGDIVNSTPIISAKGDDYGYRGLRSADGATGDVLNYANYLTTKRTSTRQPFVYVGANDGMFHAFDGSSGKEAFAYIPATSVGHMGNLLFPYVAADRNDQVFQHRYYVDGLVTVSDAHDGSAWKTVVAASVGAGGRGVFALDVTNQTALNVLWEINDKVSDASGGKDIGSVLGKIAIVPIKEAGGAIKWKAVFGNGYDSVNGKAVLFLVDIADGKVTRITATETSGTLPTRAKNGLGNVVVIDRYQGTGTTQVRDGFADTVYAGDLNGAVWKFDLRNNSVALGGKPLFIARYKDDYALRQPILGGFEATTVGNDVMVLFGTGSFSFSDDPTDKAMQSVYGIIDRNAVVTGRSELQAQFIKEEKDSSGAILRYMTDSRLDATKKGWYINLGVDTAGAGNPVATGERFVGNPRLQNGILFFPTYDPNSADGCSTDGNNWLYGLDALSGAGGMANARVGSATGNRFGDKVGAVKLKGQASGKGSGAVKDIAVAATAPPDILPVTATDEQIAQAVAAKCSVMVQTSGSQPIYLPRPCGRQSWRQIR